MSNPDHVPLEPEDLDSLDRAILDFLLEGRDQDRPWGIATPTVVLAALEERGFDVPTRQTINNRMKDMALAGHLENRYDKGEYVLVDDPRDE